MRVASRRAIFSDSSTSGRTTYALPPRAISRRISSKTFRRPSSVTTFVRTGILPRGISSSTETSRSPYSAIASVRGIGVAVMTRRCGEILPFLRREARCSTPKPVLLVDDAQRQVAERDALLDQGMRPHDDVRLPVPDPFSNRFALLRRQRGGEEGDTDRQSRRPFQEPPVMLLRQDLRGRHHRGLHAVPPGDHRGDPRDDRFPAAHVALQEPVHRMRLPEVLQDLVDHPPLGAGQVERKPALDLVDDLPVPWERNRRLPLRPRPAESQRPLEREQLAEDQAPLLRGGEFPEPLRVGVVARKVDGGERLLEGRDPDPREDAGRETFDLRRSVPADHLPLDLAEDPGRNPFHVRIDGDDPAGMDRVRGVFLREDLRMVHFGEDAEPPRGSAERHRLSDPEPFGEGGMEAEPFRREATGAVADHDLEDPGRAEPFPSALHRKDLPADGYGHPRLELPDGHHLAPVFVIPREEVEGVVRGPDPPGGELLPQAGSHPLDVLDGVRRVHRVPAGFGVIALLAGVIGPSAGSSRGTPGDSARTGRPRSGPRSRGRRRAPPPGW